MTKSKGIYHRKGTYERPCAGCGIVMVFKFHCQLKGQKYCSRECYANSRRGVPRPSKLKGTIKVPRETRICVYCGTFFKIKWWRKTKFCSKECCDQGKVGRKHTAATKRKMSKSSKEAAVFQRLWKDPEFRKKRMKGLHKKPNQPEKWLRTVLEEMYPGEYRYVGNGEVHIGRLCPDFINVNGQKKIIEVFGESFHDPEQSLREVPYSATEEGRRKRFAKYGYDMLVVWSKELFRDGDVGRKRLKRKIKEFHEDRSH